MLTHNGNQVLTMSPEIILQFLDPGSEGPLKYPLDVCPFDRLSVCPFVCAFVQNFSSELLAGVFWVFLHKTSFSSNLKTDRAIF